MINRLPHPESHEWEKIVPPLTFRQRQIVKCIDDGLTTNEACRQIGIARRTFYGELDSLRVTHQCQNNAQLYLKLGGIMAAK